MQNLGTPPGIRKLARIAGKPGNGDRLRRALADLESATRSEPGCREFTFYQAISDPDAFVLLEHFVDQAALDRHMTLEHTRAFFSAQLVSGVKAIDVPDLV